MAQDRYRLVQVDIIKRIEAVSLGSFEYSNGTSKIHRVNCSFHTVDKTRRYGLSFLLEHHGTPFLLAWKASTVEFIDLFSSSTIPRNSSTPFPLLFSFFFQLHPIRHLRTPHPNITNLQPARLLDVNHFGFFGLCFTLDLASSLLTIHTHTHHTHTFSPLLTRC